LRDRPPRIFSERAEEEQTVGDDAASFRVNEATGDGVESNRGAEFDVHIRRFGSGGGYYGNNSGVQTILTLPNSKARIRAPMYEYWNATPGYDGKRRGTRPDYTVETKAANLLRGVDEQLELALKLATQAPSQGKN
jgi:hypothetical protein